MHQCCPHHAQPLRRHPHGGVTLWVCARCDGLWVPGKVVVQVADGAPHWPLLAERLATTLCCPDDGKPLHAIRSRGIELDWCAHCHGVWLDKGELDVIAAKEANGSSSTLGTAIVDGTDAALTIAAHTAEAVTAVLPAQPAASVDPGIVADVASGLVDSGALEQIGELAGGALDAALGFIGDVFSAF
jgi:Zn-finger nucleic acid-binding protein